MCPFRTTATVEIEGVGSNRQVGGSEGRIGGRGGESRAATTKSTHSRGTSHRQAALLHPNLLLWPPPLAPRPRAITTLDYHNRGGQQDLAPEWAARNCGRPFRDPLLVHSRSTSGPALR